MLWFDIKGASRAIAYANYHAVKGGLIITANEQDAKTLRQEMAFFEPSLEGRLIYLPDSETLPFDLQKAPAVIMSQRAHAFNRLVSGDASNLVVILSASNCMRIISGPSFWTGQVKHLTPGVKLCDFFGDRLPQSLSAMGYEYAPRVKSPGTWSRRGLVLDIYPVGMSIHDGIAEHMAVRILMNHDEEIVSIRKLDTLTQESTKPVIEQFDLFPNREYAITKASCESFRRAAFSAHEEPRSTESYKCVSRQEDHPELASWIALPNTDHTNVLAIAPGDSVIFDGDAEAAFQRQATLVESRHLDVKDDNSRLCPPTHFSWLSPESVHEALKGKQYCRLERTGGASGMERPGTLSAAVGLLKTMLSDGVPTLFVMKSQVRMRNIGTICRMCAHPASTVPSFNAFLENPKGVACTHGDLIEGFSDPLIGYRVVTEPEVFGTTIESAVEEELGAHQRKVILQGLGDIQINDPIVHATNGIGRFLGFEVLDLGTGLEDLVKIGYANKITAFVRVNDLDLISRYSGAEPEKAPLTKLGDEAWMKGLHIAQQSAFTAARELIAMRNIRQRSTGVVLDPPNERYVSFCETFPYEETKDQKRTVIDIIEDLTSGKPMDRLVCGDVGFGKTEVAMRAAFLVSSQKHQVSLLAPTILLAQQHYETACKRFEDTPIKIMLADRNSLSAKELKAIKNGEVDILIGTHRILQADVEFKSLGLIIVDEEHKFGVKQKELLRSMRGSKHMLALAATPIPRTLGMAISKIREISIIATPPASRLSVRTLVRPHSSSVIREAFAREMSRSGQIFYLHNRIEDMDECVAVLQGIAPQARIRKLHGKMSADELTRIMFAFRNHEFDVLVSTTVIEVGIDVPNANTLIVEDADNLGLAQLHQLRGRVGRSSTQAYAYLLNSDREDKVSNRRLKALERASNLGEGVLVARHDMEIRGIGEILGDEQSGHIHNIGFTLYMRLLEQAIKAIDRGETNLDKSIILNHVNMPIYGKIPPEFMPDNGERLTWYQRMMSSESIQEINQNANELQDLYGYVPGEIYELKRSISEHIAAKRWCISSLKDVKEGVLIQLHNENELSGFMIVLSQTFKKRFKPAEKERTFIVENASISEVADAILAGTMV